MNERGGSEGRGFLSEMSCRPPRSYVGLNPDKLKREGLGIVAQHRPRRRVVTTPHTEGRLLYNINFDKLQYKMDLERRRE